MPSYNFKERFVPMAHHLSKTLTCSGPAKNRRELDFYATPKACTVALMDFLKLDTRITVWECACGAGDMASVIRNYGHRVISTDISKGQDFLKIHRTAGAIITNPPFNQSAQFIYKAVQEADVVCMLLKSQYWHARSRLALFEQHRPAYVLPLTWRPPFLPGSATGKSIMEVAWSVWIAGRTKITEYIPLPKPSGL